MRTACRTSLLALVLSLTMAAAASPAPQHGIAMHGEPHYQAGFTHFDYANPDAPKGGRLRQAIYGTFDSLNPLIIQGKTPVSFAQWVFEPLMARSFDEPFSLYGLIAETIETPDDRSWVEFTLRPEARFSDGTPVTVADVLFSYDLLREHGRPRHRTYYGKVAKAEATGERKVRFTFKPDADREMPLIMGLMPILPRHFYHADTFEQPTLTALGSGPYVVAGVNPGRSLVLKRNPDYWGRNLAVTRGRFNFDEIDYEFYQDQTTLLESLSAGEQDVQEEIDPSQWETAYDFPAIHSGEVIKTELPLGLPAPISALVFNTRRPLFADQRVRRALNDLFDDVWIDRNIYRGKLDRLASFFQGSVLSADGVPADERERALLRPFEGLVKPEVMAGQRNGALSEGQGWNREGMRRALELLRQAGWSLKGGVLRNDKTGEPFAFETLVESRYQSRVVQAYRSMLAHAGIDMRVRQVDSALLQLLLNRFDFDMVQYTWYPSLSPGNEQATYWGSASADAQGSPNLAGIKNPAADAMIDALIKAKGADEFTSAVRALDRVLISGDYMIPLFYAKRQWVAYRRSMHFPEKISLYGYLLDTWWTDPPTAKAGP